MMDRTTPQERRGDDRHPPHNNSSRRITTTSSSDGLRLRRAVLIGINSDDCDCDSLGSTYDIVNLESYPSAVGVVCMSL